MPRVEWPLFRGRPNIEVVLTLPTGGQQTTRVLLADTGAGSDRAAFELVMAETDCLICGGIIVHSATLGGAFSGSFPIYGVRIQVPQLGFDDDIEVVGVASVPSGFTGIAGFRFLDRFTYGNFGNRGQFGLEL